VQAAPPSAPHHGHPEVGGGAHSCPEVVEEVRGAVAAAAAVQLGAGVRAVVQTPRPRTVTIPTVQAQRDLLLLIPTSLIPTLQLTLSASLLSLKPPNFTDPHFAAQPERVPLVSETTQLH